MHLQAALAILAATCHLTAATAAPEDIQINKPLRLIKTSEEDPGQWVTEEEKDALVTASHRTSFIDITDIEVSVPFMKLHEYTLTPLSGRGHSLSLVHLS